MCRNRLRAVEHGQAAAIGPGFVVRQFYDLTTVLRVGARAPVRGGGLDAKAIGAFAQRLPLLQAAKGVGVELVTETQPQAVVHHGGGDAAGGIGLERVVKHLLHETRLRRRLHAVVCLLYVARHVGSQSGRDGGRETCTLIKQRPAQVDVVQQHMRCARKAMVAYRVGKVDLSPAYSDLDAPGHGQVLTHDLDLVHGALAPQDRFVAIPAHPVAVELRRLQRATPMHRIADFGAQR